MSRFSKMKRRATFLSAALLTVAGLSQSAEAVTFQQGDLILAIYGNRTPGEGKEAIINLSEITPTSGTGGDLNALTTGSTIHTFDLSAFLNAAGIIDTNPATPAYPVRYTVMGFQPDVSTGGFDSRAGSSVNLAGTVHPAIGSFPVGMNSWSGNINDANAPRLNPGTNGSVVAFDSSISHSTRTGTSERLFNAFNNVMASNLDQLLHIIQGDSELVDQPLIARGQALLASNGIFQITGAVIPLPAAAILFGTGLIGLAGIARRNLFGRAA